MSKQLRCCIPCIHAEVEGGFRQSSCRSMVSKFGRRSICSLQDLQNTTMHQPAAWGRQVSIGHFADLAMAEVVGICSMFNYDTPLPQFIQETQQSLFIIFAQFG